MHYFYAGVLFNMLIKRVPYTFNRGGDYYFTRRVPTDLQKHYLCPRIVQGLNTKCSSTAKTRALAAAARLNEYWSHLRITDPDLIGHHLLKTLSPRQVAKADLSPAQSVPCLSPTNLSYH